MYINVYILFFNTIGLTGIITGTVIHSIYKYPETGKKVLVVSTISGQNRLESLCTTSTILIVGTLH